MSKKQMIKCEGVKTGPRHVEGYTCWLEGLQYTLHLFIIASGEHHWSEKSFGKENNVDLTNRLVNATVLKIVKRTRTGLHVQVVQSFARVHSG
jgi:hypothetical protein